VTLGRRRDPIQKEAVVGVQFRDLCEEVDEALLPPLDRAVPPPEMDPMQRFWRDNGYLLLPNFMPSELIDAYVRVREAHGEYHTPIPYMSVEEIRDLCCYKPLVDHIERVIGEPVGLHLNLTGWVSTERDWHQDWYLNPPHVGGYYVAVWIALDEIDPESGPFEFVLASHRWNPMTQQKTLGLLAPEERASPSWPKTAERYVTQAVESEIARTQQEIAQFIAQKGDVLIWHSRLVHRGSPPRIKGRERRAIIAHYSGVYHRRDMPLIRRHRDQGYYFDL
jgi:hypothetical protein